MQPTGALPAAQPRAPALPSTHMFLLLFLRAAAGNGTVTPTQLTQMRRRYLAAMRFKIPVEHRGAKWLVDKALSNAWLVGHIALMMPQVGGRQQGRAAMVRGCRLGHAGHSSRSLQYTALARLTSPAAASFALRLPSMCGPRAGCGAGLPGACGAAPRRCLPVRLPAELLPREGVLVLQPYK